MVKKKGDCAVDRLGIDNVEVVEDESEVVLDRIDFIYQARQDRLDRWRFRRLQQRECSSADRGVDLLKCANEIGPETHGVVVAVIKREPCCGPFAGWGSCHPFSQQRTLAETRRRGDECQLALDPLL